MGRVLGIDWGTKRHGLALSDGLRIAARGIGTLERPRTRAEEFARLADVVRREEVDLVVLGLPRNMDGSPGTHAPDVRSFADALSGFLGLEVRLVDERRSTVEAERHLRSLGAGRKRTKKRVDAVAAAVILQGFLDAKEE